MKQGVWDAIKFDKASRQNREHSANWLAAHPESIPEFMDLLLSAPPKQQLICAYVFELFGSLHLTLLSPYMNQVIRHLEAFKLSGAQRALLHVLHLYLADEKKNLDDIDEDLFQTLVSYCFDVLITDPPQPVANEVHAMSCLTYCCSRAIWIQEPLSSLLLENLPKRSAGYQSRAKKVLKSIQK